MHGYWSAVYDPFWSPRSNNQQRTTIPMPRYTKIDTLDDFLSRDTLRHCVIQDLDFTGVAIDWSAHDATGSAFLGCTFPEPGVEAALVHAGALVFPEVPDLPFRPYRPSLYTWRELLDGYSESDDRSLDLRIYRHAQSVKQTPVLLHELAQRIHDHAIDDALDEFLDGRRVVGIMGGHGAPRTNDAFRDVAWIARALTRDGYTIASGGGPGIMEAANLGAWLASSPDPALDEALAILAEAPRYTDSGYVARARQVIEAIPQGADSLAVPTWFYGHEPTNLFASHIAKYFSNSLREDGLLAIAIHGVIYARGSAGTLQEVFMDLCQNHYTTFEYISPMVFLDPPYYRDRIGLWPMLEKFMDEKDAGYRDYLAITGNPAEAVDFIQSHPPRQNHGV